MRPRWWIAAGRLRLVQTLVVFLTLAGSLFFKPLLAVAQQPETNGALHNEYMVKAVFLYSFGRYVEWPKSAFANDSGPFVIGILGEDSFEGALDAIAAKKTIQNRQIVVRRFATVETYSPPCNILFVSKSLTPDQQSAVIAKTEGKPVFVVGETPGFAERGATANFIVDGERIMFEINVDAVRRAQLHMDAKLLSLGKTIGAGKAGITN